MLLIKHDCLIFLILSSIYWQPVYATNLTVCIEDKLYIPYLDRSVEKLADGLLVQLVTKSANKNKFNISFTRQSWPRCLQQITTGKVDAIMAAIYTPDRAASMVFPTGAENPKPSVYLWQINYPYFVKKGAKFSLTSNNKTLNFGIGTPYQYVTYQMLAKRNLLPAYDYDLETGLTMVAAGKLDAYVVETSIGLNSLAKLQLQYAVEPTAEIFLESYWHIAFNSTYYLEHQVSVDALWRDLAQIRETLQPTLK